MHGVPGEIRTHDPQIRNLNWPSGFFYLFKLSYDSITACFRVFIAYAIQSISNFKKLGRAFTIVVLEGYGAKKNFCIFYCKFLYLLHQQDRL